MNKQRRRDLEDIVSKIEGAISDLEYVINDEEAAYDALPESLQYSEKGEAMEDNVSDLNDALADLESAVDQINDVIER